MRYFSFIALVVPLNVSDCDGIFFPQSVTKISNTLWRRTLQRADQTTQIFH